MNKDYYKILGVSEDASKDEIKKAFKSLAKEWHPDVVAEEKKGEAAEKFKEYNEAAYVLTDDQRRKEYDTNRKFGGGINISQQDFANFFMNDDILNSLFGFNIRKPSSEMQMNPNLIAQVVLMPHETIADVEKEINIERDILCEECSGNGGFDFHSCPECNGQGFKQVVHGRPGMQLVQQTMCYSCRGTGKTIGKTCNKCGGRGKTTDNKKITVKIPAGSIGKTIRVSGIGHSILKNVSPGNVMISVLFANDDTYYLQDAQTGRINRKIEVDPIVAILGGTMNIHTLDAQSIPLTLEENTKQGDTFFIPNQGAMGWNKSRGPMIVVVSYKDVDMTVERRDALQKYIETLDTTTTV